MIDDPEVVTRDFKFYPDLRMFGCHFEENAPLGLEFSLRGEW